MKRILKYIILSALPVALSGMAQAQTAIDTVCKGETICLTTPSFRGTIQWQSSPDAAAWTDIPGATNDSTCVVINDHTYYRGVITENSCDPFYTDTNYFMVNDYNRSITFNYTGALQTWTAPANVCDSVFIQVWGAQGGSGATGDMASTGGIGGLGGYSEGYIAIAPGQVLNLMVGGAGSAPVGGFNGGADGGTQDAGGGGGASDVRYPGILDSDRIIVAGGGGGGGRGGCETGGVNGGNGGEGGGGNGFDGTNSPDGGGGFGAIGTNAGAAGIGCAGYLGTVGNPSSGSAGGVGGSGQNCCCFSIPSIPGGGGGGGGFLGGGGGGGGSAGTTACSGNNKGGGGGGAGGTNYTGGVVNGISTLGIWTGNGQIIISY